MELFVSGEVSEAAGKGLRVAAVEVMDSVNAVTERRDYGSSIAVWYFIAILFEAPRPGFPETTEYNREKRYVAFRRNLDFFRFVEAAEREQCRQIYQGVLNSILVARELNIPSFSFEEFERDLTVIGEMKGWL
jgi:hypothetical protein